MSTQHSHSASLPALAPPIGVSRLSLFPPTRRQPVPGLDYYGASRTAAGSAGDFFEFNPLDGGRLFVSTGETLGSGVPPLVMTAAVRAHFHAVASGGVDALAAAAGRLNRTLCGAAAAGPFTMLFCACIDPARRALRYLSAGHQSALLIRAVGWRTEFLETTGTVLGLSNRAAYRQRTVAFCPGDVLIAFSGGVAGTVDGAGRELGEAGMVEAAWEHRHDPPRILVERVLETVASYGDGAAQSADQTVLAVRFASSADGFIEDDTAGFAFAAA
jgi:sigma-B regulation protein RsbU (phosphoserine phosphatase)